MNIAHCKMMGAVTALTLLISAPLHAVVNLVTNTVTVSATAQLQRPGATVAGVTRTPLPTKMSITTKSILAAAAAQASTTFPIGARLVTTQQFGSTPTAYLVYSKTNQVLLDVSTLMDSTRVTLLQSNVSDLINGLFVQTGSVSPVTNLAIPSQTIYEFYVFNYHDGTTFFSMLGQMTHTRSDSRAVAGGIYNESQTNKSNAMSGNGLTAGVTFVITGTLNYSGTSSQSL